MLAQRSGEVVTFALDEQFGVNEVLAIERGAIRSGSSIGTATATQPDGTLRTIEMLVFPEAAR